MKRITCLLFAVLVLAGCGGASNQADEATASKASVAAAAKAKAKAKAYKTCDAVFNPFYTKLHELDSRLNVGLTQADYNTALGDARVPYDDATPKFSSLDAACIKAGHQLELAFNNYIKANTYWSNCIQNTYCTVDESTLQAKWTPAQEFITKYEDALAAMKP